MRHRGSGRHGVLMVRFDREEPSSGMLAAGGASTLIGGGGDGGAMKEGSTAHRTCVDDNPHSSPLSSISHIYYPATPPKKAQQVVLTANRSTNIGSNFGDCPTLPPPTVTLIFAAGDYSKAVVGSRGDL